MANDAAKRGAGVGRILVEDARIVEQLVAAVGERRRRARVVRTDRLEHAVEVGADVEDGVTDDAVADHDDLVAQRRRESFTHRLISQPGQVPSRAVADVARQMARRAAGVRRCPSHCGVVEDASLGEGIAAPCRPQQLRLARQEKQGRAQK